MAPDITGDLATARGVADVDCVLEIELFTSVARSSA